ncbi:MAG: lipid-A-disaccharide synthase [Ectothiorhodospiraceae bacterium]|jgi:lipid-A-disaccharide synthase
MGQRQLKRVAIVAGELSGDVLGADLMRAIKARHPGVRFEGIGGPAMLREGLEGLYPLESLSVMGLVEVLRHLPRLLRIRRELFRHFRDNPPDAFVGIDAPDFNLGLERRLRVSGVPTAHYVSPSVWAWREGRITGIARSVDLMLTLLPFEARFYEEHGVPVEFVGHPTADRYPMDVDRERYRRQLNMDPRDSVVAVLPGSRNSEVERIGAVFAQTLALLQQRHPRLRIVSPMATHGIRRRFDALLRAAGVDNVELLDGNAEAAMGAADVVLTASGTATLEAMLLKRPMVVAYKVSPITAWLVKRLNLIRVKQVSLPNLLAQETLVPELIQDAATPAALAEQIEHLLQNPARARQLENRFRELHGVIRRNASERAAGALERLLAT